jgi:predicted nucleic acid-binding protein
MNRNPDFIVALEEVTRRAEKGDLILVTSVFTMAEVAQVDESADAETQEKMILDFFENDFIYVVAFDESICKSARQIIRSTKMKGKDAVHVATALSVPHVSSMHTYDTELLRKARKLVNSKLPIERASEWLITTDKGQTSMHLESS